MKNTLADLNNALFEQLERLQDDELMKEDNFEKELKRSEAVTKIANTIIQSGNLAVKAQHDLDEYGGDKRVNMPLLDVKEE